jgi:hypothetical protein
MRLFWSLKNKFKKEEQKFISKQNQVRQDTEEIASIELILKELKQFTETNNDAQILQKIHDITTFLHKSFTDLDIITKKQISQKSEIFIDPNFKPLSLNVKKALDIVKKFEMVLPSINQKVKNQESAMINSMSMNPLYGRNSSRSQNPAMQTTEEDDLNPAYQEEQIARSTGRNVNMMPISMSGRGAPSGSSTIRGGMEHSSRKESMQKGQYDDFENEENEDTAVLTCFGDASEILQYTLGRFTWEKLKYESNAAYTGSLKYMSSCSSPDGRIYMTGGVLVSNNHPSSTWYEVSANRVQKNIKKRNMQVKRFGHSAIFLNGYVYAVGGFSHKDVPNETPVTLGSVERFAIHENKWYYVASMNEARAFWGIWKVDNQYIYVFGGLHDYQVLNNVEKYDVITDTWVSLYYKLPIPLAKLGAWVIDKKTIMIAGGITADYEASDSWYALDLQTIKWNMKQSMKVAKLLSSGLFFSKGWVYTVGGNKKGKCERYHVENNYWELIPSYIEVSDYIDLYTWTMTVT